jgi:hypothetical protein
MGAKVLRAIVVALGALVLAVLAFVVVYVIGYGLFAIFSHGAMSGGAARAVGVAIAAVLALVILALYLRTRISGAPAGERHSHHKRAA